VKHNDQIYLKLIQEFFIHFGLDFENIQNPKVYSFKLLEVKKTNKALDFFKNNKHVDLSHGVLSFSKETPTNSWKDNLKSLGDFCLTLVKDLPFDVKYWNWPKSIDSVGFSNDEMKLSEQIIGELYNDDFLVAEKKPLLLDLDRSKGPYLVSEPEATGIKSIFDGASQIGTLSIGHNEKYKDGIVLRYMAEDFSTLGLKDGSTSETYLAHKNQILNEFKNSPLKHVYYVNSGAEAIEASLKILQAKNPERRKLISFEGSFHGRCVLSLAATYNPVKREPFELEKDLVTFLPFAENKNPKVEPSFSTNWVKAWSCIDEANFNKLISEFEKIDTDPLLVGEIKSLKLLRSSLQKNKCLALLLEPMQGEGGDRYGTKRYYNAIRAVTRAFNTPLVIDEVQMGYGLGGEFLWFQLFDFIDSDGNPDFPDIVTMAKKSQLGCVLSSIEASNQFEYISNTSLHRGYLQGHRCRVDNHNKIEELVYRYLSALQDSIEDQVISNIRNVGYTFAFDVPSKDFAMYLIKVRFKNGSLFYPAGEKTLRFRLLNSIPVKELNSLFWSIFQCLEDASVEESFKFKINKNLFFERLPEIKKYVDEKPAKLVLENSFNLLSSDLSKCLEYKSSDWLNIFNQLFKVCPQIIYSANSLNADLKVIRELGINKYINEYSKNINLPLLDWYWNASRAFGANVIQADLETLEKNGKEINSLEKKAYESERVDDVETFKSLCKNSSTVCLLAFDNVSSELVGLTIAAPIKEFANISLVKDDLLFNDPNVYYSADLTIHPKYQGKGFGRLMKIEQLITVCKNKGKIIRSRNKIPEANSMTELNLRLGAVEIDRSENDYGGNHQARYLSISLPSDSLSKSHSELELKIGAMKNKVSLGNFVSRKFCNNLFLIKHLIPADLRHVFTSSGISESADKIAKLLFYQNPQSNIILSPDNINFNLNTAVGRSLGVSQNTYFKWPKVKIDDFEKSLASLAKQHKSNLLGYFDYIDNPSDINTVFKRVSQVKKYDFPKALIIKSFDQDFWLELLLKNQSFINEFDLVAWQSQPQLSIVATKIKYFLKKPLMMISTWEGDELSLMKTRDEVFEYFSKQ